MTSEIPSNRAWTGVHLALLGLLVAALLAPTPADRPDSSAPVTFALEAVSSPPDLVSGDAARVRVHVPRQVPLNRVTVTHDGADVTAAFAPTTSGHGLEGVVTGLARGTNELEARIVRPGQGARRAQLTLTNHGLHEPMFSGPAQVPFQCTAGLGGTGVAGSPQLSPGSPPDCDTGMLVSHVYRTTTGSWAHYDPAAPPDPAQVATTTTLDGLEVPFVVRWERGTINRFLYSGAVLAPPPVADDTTDLAHWNQRLIFSFQGGVGIGRTQGSPSTGAMLFEWGLANGYAVVWSSGTRTIEYIGMQETIFDPFDTPEVSKAMGEAERLLGTYINGVVDEVLMRSREMDPDFVPILAAALNALEAHNNPEQLAHVALSCRRALNKLADILLPPRPPTAGSRRLGPDAYRNRLWAYAEERLDSDSKAAVVLTTLTDVGSRIDALDRAANKGVHSFSDSQEIQRLVLSLLLLVYDLMTLSPPVGYPAAAYERRLASDMRDLLMRSIADDSEDE